MSDADYARHEARGAPVSDCPVVEGNAVRLLDCGHTAITAIFDAIEGAQDHIHLEYYILQDVHMDGRSLSGLLLAAAARGVRIALSYDSAGSHATPDALFDRFEKAGIPTLEFRPLNPLRRHFAWHLNDRDHRKLVVVDGTIAIMGGVNMSRVYENPAACGIAPDPSRSFWHDCAIRLDGPIVAWAQRIFLDTWTRNGGDALQGDGFFPDLAERGDHRVRLAASAPLEQKQLYFEALREAIAAARHTILLTTGYFVPSRPDWQGLADAAARGVRVDLVLASRSDTPATLHAARALYGRLLGAGVQIHELQDGFLHAKAATIDGVWSVIGSSNFDRRSFNFNNEIDAVLLGREAADDVATMLQSWMKRAETVTLDSWRRRSWRERGQEYSARLWERYM